MQHRADPHRSQDVDIVYIATPHTGHFALGKLAIEAGKNVLIEKVAAFTFATDMPHRSLTLALAALYSQRRRIKVPD